MGSCLGARRRKGLRGILLKLFSRDLAFIVISISPTLPFPAGRHHVAVAGFCSASFEGETKVTM